MMTPEKLLNLEALLTALKPIEEQAGLIDSLRQPDPYDKERRPKLDSKYLDQMTAELLPQFTALQTQLDRLAAEPTILPGDKIQRLQARVTNLRRFFGLEITTAVEIFTAAPETSPVEPPAPQTPEIAIANTETPHQELPTATSNAATAPSEIPIAPPAALAEETETIPLITPTERIHRTLTRLIELSQRTGGAIAAALKRFSPNRESSDVEDIGPLRVRPEPPSRRQPTLYPPIPLPDRLRYAPKYHVILNALGTGKIEGLMEDNYFLITDLTVSTRMFSGSQFNEILDRLGPHERIETLRQQTNRFPDGTKLHLHFSYRAPEGHINHFIQIPQADLAAPKAPNVLHFSPTIIPPLSRDSEVLTAIIENDVYISVNLPLDLGDLRIGEPEAEQQLAWF